MQCTWAAPFALRLPEPISKGTYEGPAPSPSVRSFHASVIHGDALLQYRSLPGILQDSLLCIKILQILADVSWGCIHHHRIGQNSFSNLKFPCALPPGNHCCFYCLCSFAFCRFPSNWNQAVDISAHFSLFYCV